MTTKQTTVRIHYYFVKFCNDFTRDAVEIGIDREKRLEMLLRELDETPVMERVYSPNNNIHNEIRLQNISKRKDRYWILNFVKVRDDVSPGKVNGLGEFNQIELGSDEYVGEDMTVIYDPETCILAAQRNFYSVSVEKVCDYFNKMQEVKNIPGSFDFEMLIESDRCLPEDCLIRSVEVSCYDLSGGTVEEVLRNEDSFGAKQVKLVISVGSRRKDAGLASSIRDYIKPFFGRASTTNLKVKYNETENSLVSEIDFVNARLESKISLMHSRDNPVSHKRIYTEMLPVVEQVINNLG